MNSDGWKEAFLRADRFAQMGRFDEMLSACTALEAEWKCQPHLLLSVGSLLRQYGFIGRAEAVFKQVGQDASSQVVALVNLAAIALDAGNHELATAYYKSLCEANLQNDVIRRNALLAFEYDPNALDRERYLQAKAWGELVVKKSGGCRPRPKMTSYNGRMLRVGYVTADACQHTVGLFIKDILKAHDRVSFLPYLYSSGAVEDWVTSNIKTSVEFRDIKALDDQSVAALITQDEIDILVDLSGHTAGSRLSAFAYRPASVMVSWLGYFATTGLTYMDAVLLDEWHVTSNTEKTFCEKLVNVEGGRFCYNPVPWMPDVSDLPASSNGYVTFGSFNNTAKYNAQVFDLWAEVLRSIPGSRLVLKWRTFNDTSLRESVLSVFEAKGVHSERIEFRGPSFHPDMLKEYADIDIALDPFPFSGGLTSCEALWMGVPVVTWPQERVVSRQTYAFLCAIGLENLAASSRDDYVAIATRLANDLGLLSDYRSGLRDRMRRSSLMNVVERTRALERVYLDLYREIFESEMVASKKVLHVGCGHPMNGASLPKMFSLENWQEVRFDIDPLNEPDIVGSLQDMQAVADSSMDAVYSSHNIEHVYAFEVPQVLREFYRVLRADGYALITCPDLQSVCQFVVDDRLADPAYMSPAGPIAPLDIIYGHGQALAAGHDYMAHKTGFTLKTMMAVLKDAGFKRVAGKRRPDKLDIWVVATKDDSGDEFLKTLAKRIFPT